MLSDEKIGGYYRAVCRVLMNIFDKREFFAYVTSLEKDSGIRQLFFSTVFPKRFQILSMTVKIILEPDGKQRYVRCEVENSGDNIKSKKFS